MMSRSYGGAALRLRSSVTLPGTVEVPRVSLVAAELAGVVEIIWARCHVPHGSTADMSDAIERQIERFAPDFRGCVVRRHAMGPAEMERRNANLIGGDIAGGASTLARLVARPVVSLNPYATPLDGVYLCSSSTPPGVGVHGMYG